MSYELLLDDRAIADRAVLLSIVHIVNSVNHYDSRTKNLFVTSLIGSNSRNIRIFGDLDFSERLLLGKMEKR